MFTDVAYGTLVMAFDRRRFLSLTGSGAGFALSGSLGGLLTVPPPLTTARPPGLWRSRA